MGSYEALFPDKRADYLPAAGINLDLLAERNNQNEISYEDFAESPGEITINNLSATSMLVALVVRTLQANYSIFNKNVTEMTVRSIKIPDAKYLRRTSRLPSKQMDRKEKMLPERIHYIQIRFTGCGLYMCYSRLTPPGL